MARGRVPFDRIEYVHSIGHLAEHNVLVVQMRGLLEAEEELAAVGVRACVRHGQRPAAFMLIDEVLVRELHAVDRDASCSIFLRKVATLGHEARDHAMEDGVFEVQVVALGFALLAGAECAEIIGRLRSVAVELHGDPADWLTINCNVKEDRMVLARRATAWCLLL